MCREEEEQTRIRAKPVSSKWIPFERKFHIILRLPECISSRRSDDDGDAASHSKQNGARTPVHDVSSCSANEATTTSVQSP